MHTGYACACFPDLNLHSGHNCPQRRKAGAAVHHGGACVAKRHQVARGVTAMGKLDHPVSWRARLAALEAEHRTRWASLLGGAALPFEKGTKFMPVDQQRAGAIHRGQAIYDPVADGVLVLPKRAGRFLNAIGPVDFN